MLTQTQIDKARKIFQAYDLDKNGTIDIVELREALKMMGMSPSDLEVGTNFFLRENSVPNFFQVTKVMAEVDGNGSGMIDFYEFVNVSGAGCDLQFTQTSDAPGLGKASGVSGSGEFRGGSALLICCHGRERRPVALFAKTRLGFHLNGKVLSCSKTMMQNWEGGCGDDAENVGSIRV